MNLCRGRHVPAVRRVMVIRVMLVGTVGIRLVISVDVVNDLEVLQHDMRGRRQPEGRQRQHDDAL